MSSTHSDHYILFTVNNTSYALPSEDVAHVEMVDEVTRVPNAAPYVDGVVFSRGQVVPALNMRARFGFERQPLDISARLLVVHREGRTVGLLVDACREFLTIPASAVHPPGDAMAAAHYFEGVATVGNRLIIILDLVKLLESAEPILAA
jgi:chemotaxis signal transduction protein